MMPKKLLLALIIILLTSLNCLGPNNSNGSYNQIDNKVNSFELSEETYEPHDRIVIFNDEMLNEYGFPGEGTDASPFLIQGLNITTISTCIFIMNTSKQILITSCWLKTEKEVFGGYNISTGIPANVSTGIIITQVAPGTVSITNNVIIGGSVQAVAVVKSNGVLISNNEIFERRIIISQANNILILANELNHAGISILDSNNSEIRLNSCFSGGIHAIFSFNLTICNNLAQNSLDGILLMMTHNSLITWNKVINNEIGISIVFSSSNNLIHHNTLINNSDSQAVDLGVNNTWHDPETLEGNWWSDYNGTGVYTFYYYATDYYPLLILEEDSNTVELIAIIVIIALVIGLSPAIILFLRKRKI